MTQTITLIRHGRTEANEKKIYCGSTDTDLSSAGVDELRELKKNILYPRADVYAASGKRRTLSTLSILCGETAPVIIPELSEYDFGDFEMKSHDELSNDPLYNEWIMNENARCPNGESRNEFRSRVGAGLDKLKTFSGAVVCVCHGGVIAVLMEALFPGIAGFYEWQPGFGRGYTVGFGVDINYEVI